MQRRVTAPGPLLDGQGRLAEPGWATSLVKQYERDKIKKSAMRIKEWDYYCVVSDRYALALTVADNGYMGLDSVSLMDFDERRETTRSRTKTVQRSRTNEIRF